MNIKRNRFKKGSVYQPNIRRPSIPPQNPYKPAETVVLTASVPSSVPSSNQSLPRPVAPIAPAPVVTPVAPLPPVQSTSPARPSIPPQNPYKPAETVVLTASVPSSVPSSNQSLPRPVAPIAPAPVVTPVAPLPPVQSTSPARPSIPPQNPYKPAETVVLTASVPSSVPSSNQSLPRPVAPIKPVWATGKKRSIILDRVETPQRWNSKQAINRKSQKLKKSYTKLPKLKPFIKVIAGKKAVLKDLNKKIFIVSSLVTATIIIIAVAAYGLYGTKHRSLIVQQSKSGALSVSTATASASQLADSPSVTLSSPSKSTSAISPTLNFTPVVPEGEDQLAEKGSQDYDSTHGIYTFDDLFLAQPLQVSEQILPRGYGSVAATVSAAAKSFKATTPITTISGVTAYMATDSATQDQTVIYSTCGLLILIKSSYEHSATDWAIYLESLQQP